MKGQVEANRTSPPYQDCTPKAVSYSWKYGRDKCHHVGLKDTRVMIPLISIKPTQLACVEDGQTLENDNELS